MYKIELISMTIPLIKTTSNIATASQNFCELFLLAIQIGRDGVFGPFEAAFHPLHLAAGQRPPFAAGLYHLQTGTCGAEANMLTSAFLYLSIASIRAGKF